MSGQAPDCVRAALRALDVENLVLGIHDASFPSGDGDDSGRGTPCSPAGLELLRFARELGFGGLQLGPQGQTPAHSASPYESTVFSRNVLSISLARLVEDEAPWSGLLARERLARIVDGCPEGGDARVPYGYVYRSFREALGEAFEAFRRGGGADAAALAAALAGFRERHADWLERDALYEALRVEHGGAPWRRWGGTPAGELDRRLWSAEPRDAEERARRRRALREKYAQLIEFYAFSQLLAHAHHERVRAAARALGLRLYGDLQIGLSERDAWSQQRCFLSDYVLGAPPSRTNPEGQPWRYPQFDPERYGDVLRLVSARVDKLFSEFDGVRIDHPHGLVCPWVYLPDDGDPGAVARGARLFSSPDLPDHPGLARFAIARRPQLNPDPETPRYADDWVVELDPEQVDRYAILFAAIVAVAGRHGRALSDLVCEVLSTLPTPLARVLERYGLGRFRVTQKADPSDPQDVYRSENALPADWIMLGNHDTPPIWRLVEEWSAREIAERARYLGERLVPEPRERRAFRERLVREPLQLAHAQFADLFASRARNAMIFFTDLFGLRESYNRPGTVSPDNWSLRLPRDFRRAYRERLRSDRALNLPAALALGLRARGGDPALIARLEAQAASLRAG